MELIRFVFWEVCQGSGIGFPGDGCRQRRGRPPSGPLAKVRRSLCLILVLVALGAWYAGNDVAAEVYMWSSDSSLAAAIW